MMPTVKDVFDRFRRRSLPGAARFFRGSNRDDSSSSGLDHFHLRSQSVPDAPPSSNKCTDFFSLPTEIHIQILLPLSYQDLSNFWLASPRSRDLVFEGDILRQWINHSSDKQQLKLYPPPANPTFQYLLDQDARRQIATQLATVLAEYIERDILRYTLRRLDVFPNRSRNEVFQTMRSQLRDKMIPLIITLCHYLEASGLILLRAIRSDGDAFYPAYRAQEREVIESYDAEHLRQVHKFWMFLIWLSNQILKMPSYAGTVERAVRGWSMDPVNFFTYRLFLILGGAEALIHVVKPTALKHRRKVLNSLLERLDPERNIRWQQHWQALGVTQEKQVTKEQAKKILSLELSNTDVWVESAEIVLNKTGKIVPKEHIPIGTPWQVMDFLCDMAGYDVLHLPPTMP